MGGVVISKYSLFVGHTFVQRAADGWNGNHALSYDKCVILVQAIPGDSMTFGFGFDPENMVPLLEPDSDEGRNSKDEHSDGKKNECNDNDVNRRSWVLTVQ